MSVNSIKKVKFDLFDAGDDEKMTIIWISLECYKMHVDTSIKSSAAGSF